MPYEIAVVSGKGGTGKTVVASSLAAVIDSKMIADCDVDAPDMHLLLRPSIRRQEVFLGKKLAWVDQNLCTGCGKCAEVCRFAAVTVGEESQGRSFSIDNWACEGCGVCAWMCPAGAIGLKDTPGGKWFVSDTPYGPMVHACLGTAQENSGKLVTIVRREARKMAVEDESEFVIIDGPPGIGCPVIASLAGTDLAVIVTEPTVAGVHDLQRILRLTQHFHLKVGVVINKYDLNDETTEQIERFLRQNQVPLLAKIPFSGEVSRAVADGRVIVEVSDGVVARRLRQIAEDIVTSVHHNLRTRIESKAEED